MQISPRLNFNYTSAFTSLLIKRTNACRVVLYRAEIEFNEQILVEVRRLSLPVVKIALLGAVQINQDDKPINVSAGAT